MARHGWPRAIRHSLGLCAGAHISSERSIRGARPWPHWLRHSRWRSKRSWCPTRLNESMISSLRHLSFEARSTYGQEWSRLHPSRSFRAEHSLKEGSGSHGRRLLSLGMRCPGPPAMLAKPPRWPAGVRGQVRARPIVVWGGVIGRAFHLRSLGGLSPPSPRTRRARPQAADLPPPRRLRKHPSRTGHFV